MKSKKGLLILLGVIVIIGGSFWAVKTYVLAPERPATQAEDVIQTIGQVAYDLELYEAQEAYLEAVEGLQEAGSEEEEQATQALDVARVKLENMGLGRTSIEMIESVGEPDATLIEMKAGEPVWVYAMVDQKDVNRLRIGKRVDVTTGEAPDKIYPGEIRSMDRVIRAGTKRIKVRSVVENPDGHLRPNLYVNVKIKKD